MNKNQWKDKIIYQIFPRSFNDSNGDGNGDIRGITEKLDYLKDLGVDALWLCPVYDTNFADAGYDVKNYLAVWDKFGSITEMRTLCQKAKKYGISIIMDIVLNHVSNEHEWFKKACESVNNKEHDYFIWRKTLSKDEKDAKSIFGGSAWEWQPQVKKYYFHLFAKEQVDLNWEHPATIKAMSEVINFWYEIGVRGFRFDAIKHIAKVFPDGTRNDFSWGSTAVKMLQNLNKEAFKDKKDVFVLGEASGISLEEMLRYGSGKEKVAQNFYNFSWWWIGWGNETGRNGYDANWDYKNFVTAMKDFQSNEGVKPEMMTNFMTNHDTARAVSRWGDEGIFHKESAKALAMLLFSVKGIPSIYYGEEVGMLNPRFQNRKEFRDVDALNAFKILVDEKKIYSEDEMIKYHNMNSRDCARTPMSWSNKKNAGFSKNEQTWIKTGFGHESNNAEAQFKDKNSIINFYKKIIQIRKSKNYGPILVDGRSEMSLTENGAIKIIRTLTRHRKMTFLINVTEHNLGVSEKKLGTQILSSWVDNRPFLGRLRPYEAIAFADLIN